MYLSLEVFRGNGRVDSQVVASGWNNTAPPPTPKAKRKKKTNEIMLRTGLWINHRLANYMLNNEA